ncbi:MAG: hypothetical protein BWX50_00977 [Euryarchaeota archaeon ADurb.Bin009]|nr:MAG: hypothetical protein BWX50_00977 [Euryarchaeota archaeon ADurb.Bin009]
MLAAATTKVMIPSSCQPARLTSPKVQKTTAASWVSLAKNWRNIVPAVKREERATPASTITSGDAPRTRDMIRITAVARRQKMNATIVVR